MYQCDDEAAVLDYINNVSIQELLDGPEITDPDFTLPVEFLTLDDVDEQEIELNCEQLKIKCVEKVACENEINKSLARTRTQFKGGEVQHECESENLDLQVQQFICSKESQIEVSKLCIICARSLKQIVKIYGFDVQIRPDNLANDSNEKLYTIYMSRNEQNWIPSLDNCDQVKKFLQNRKMWQKKLQKSKKQYTLNKDPINFIQGGLVQEYTNPQLSSSPKEAESGQKQEAKSGQKQEGEEQKTPTIKDKKLQKKAYEGVSVKLQIALERAIGTPNQFVDQDLTGPTSSPIFKTKKQMKAAQKKQAKDERRVIAKQGQQQEQQFASFEKFTTGFGSRMMAKMGYVEGQGLGKDNQGRIEPLKPEQRPKRLGLGWSS
eukprot:TRINITY_DN2434_c0_g1_i11.p1 TRINITY_DN2434_c0_g1~~TRINITY_DN2434_c0_g1_i11.p1  ORF type:complete len:377 (-),score=58.09 TRINITY_DN2434_c0_g1_i11:433-1563(-)